MTADKQHRSPGLGGPARMAGFAIGAGAAAAAPLIARRAVGGLGIESIADVVKSPTAAIGDAASNVGERLGSGAIGKVKDAFGSHGSDDDQHDAGGVPGVGEKRRMPVQQWVDIAAPRETVYNQWTQYEQWPTFMHRVTRATQEDPCTVSFAVRIWGKTKEFTAAIETQRPDERIKWHATDGMTLHGVVTFHELGPNLTRVLLGLDLDPGGVLEKFARGARLMKRAARGDLHRFKAFVEMAEHETGAWRGVIEDGKVKRKHPASYDKNRAYADLEELTGGDEEDGDDRSRRNGSGTTSRSRGRQG